MNGTFNPKMDIIMAFFYKIRKLFSIFKKEQGRPLPVAPLVARLYITITTRFSMDSAEGRYSKIKTSNFSQKPMVLKNIAREFVEAGVYKIIFACFSGKIYPKSVT